MPDGVDERKFEAAVQDIRSSIEMFERVGAGLVKIDPDDAFYRYAHFSVPSYKFAVGLEDLARPDIVKSLTRRWSKVIEAADYFSEKNGPFSSWLYDMTKRDFGRSKGRSLAYQIIARMTTNNGTRWFS